MSYISDDERRIKYIGKCLEKIKKNFEVFETYSEEEERLEYKDESLIISHSIHLMHQYTDDLDNYSVQKKLHILLSNKIKVLKNIVEPDNQPINWSIEKANIRAILAEVTDELLEECLKMLQEQGDNQENYISDVFK